MRCIRYLRAVETLFGLWLEFMRTHLSTAVAMLLLIPTALSLDVRMAMVLMGLGVAYVAIGRLVMRKTKEGQASVERNYHNVFAHVTDSVNNVSVLQSYNRVGNETEALRAYVRDLLKAQYPVLDWWAIASAMHRLASTISMMVVLLIGAYLVMHGQLRVGNVIAFTGFASLLISRLDQISAFVNQIFEARVPTRRILQARAGFGSGQGAGRPQDAGAGHRPHPFRECRLRVPEFKSRRRESDLQRHRRSDSRDRRPDGRRQDDADQSSPARPYAE